MVGSVVMCRFASRAPCMAASTAAAAVVKELAMADLCTMLATSIQIERPKQLKHLAMYLWHPLHELS